MERIALTDGSGKWFDSEKAEFYGEKSYHDGSNWISKATGSQWEHEAVYLTKGGVFVLTHWSDFQGSRDTYVEISKEEAAVWFAKQGFSDDVIPEVFLGEVYNLEIQ